MQQVEKTLDSKKAAKVTCEEDPGDEFEKVYREVEKTFEDNKMYVDNVFSLCASQDDDDPETILLHGEGEAPAPSMAITTDTIELSVETVNAQLDLIEERMAKAAILLKENNGIEKTTIILNPPNPCSIFNNCEIHLTKFDTSPLAFNIEFLGNDPALNVFVIHMGALVDRFDQNNEGFLINRVSKGYKLNKAKKRKAKSATEVK